MMALTHAAIGTVAFAGLSALFGGDIRPALLGAAAVGSWLPDVDTPSSKAGLCCYPLAQWLEKRFGHRTVTHSAFGVAVFAALFSPLLLFAATRALFVPLLCGYVFHLLGDAATKSGVPLAWPRRERWVFPGNAQWRLTTGSPAEWGVFGVMCIGALLVVPVAQLGPRRLFHIVSGDVKSATRDVQDYAGRWALEADLEGFDVLRKTVVKGRFPVVGLRGDDGILIEREGRALWLVSKTASEADPYRIEPRRVRVHTVRELRTQQETIRAANLTLGALADRIKEPINEMPPPWELPASEDFHVADVRISGVAECYAWPEGLDAPRDWPDAPGLKRVEFEPTTRRVHLRDVAPNDLNALAHVAIRSGSFVLTRPRRMKAPRWDFPTTVRTLEVPHLRRHADLRAKIGEIVPVGAALGQGFAQTFEPERTSEDAARRADAQAATRELRGLNIEEAAMRKTSYWDELAPGFAARHDALQKRASYTPPGPVEMPTPVPVRAPFAGVVVAVEWEPPTLPTRRGEVPEHAARVTLAQVMTE